MGATLKLPGSAGNTGENGIVMYTDGGCKPSRGIGGWGNHGYLFSHDVPTKGSGCRKGFPTAGGYSENKEKDTPVTVLKYLDGYGSLIPESTNNEAELVAAIRAMEAIMLLKNEYSIKSAVIRPDSRYVIDGITQWSTKWIANKWIQPDGTEVSNSGYWKELVALADDIYKEGIKVDWEWVKGHSGEVGNETADVWASSGVIVGRKGIAVNHTEMNDPSGYWSPNPFYNRMISNAKWYFNTGGALKTNDGRWVYHLGEHGKDDEMLGKRISDGCFSVVYLKEPIAAMEIVRDYQDKVCGRHSALMIGRIDNLLVPDNHNRILKYNDQFLFRSGRFMDLYLPSGKTGSGEEDKEGKSQKDVLITKELNPPRLGFNAIESLTALQGVLDNFLDNPAKHLLTVTDISDILYEVDTSKKATTCKLRKEISSLMKSIDVDVAYNTGTQQGQVKIPLTVGIDIAKRNTLAAIACYTPKVFVVSWKESNRAFRYATVIQTPNDVGIWAGVYSNIRVLI